MNGLSTRICLRWRVFMMTSVEDKGREKGFRDTAWAIKQLC